MKVKNYLEQVEILDTKINQKIDQLNDLKLRSTSTGGFDYSERVQTSPSGDSLCRAVTDYVALEDEINADIDHFVDFKNKIINQIQTMTDVKYMKLLYMKYVQYKSLEYIAVEMNYSYPYVKELHGVALQQFQNTYPILP
ncbi:hypothetical protein LJC58_03070 [Lachnospiraceae bacterium OttesenSCG-928-D06]|nr:hypothetical protein [Lachnospiraceae bacterium OttesenSCG-928-D06]